MLTFFESMQSAELILKKTSSLGFENSKENVFSVYILVVERVHSALYFILYESFLDNVINLEIN